MLPTVSCYDTGSYNLPKRAPAERGMPFCFWLERSWSMLGEHLMRVVARMEP